VRAGKRSVRLTVNSHSTQSLPFYISLGFEIKETVCLFSYPDGLQTVPFPDHHDSLSVRAVKMGDVDQCCALMESVVGFSRRADLSYCVSYFRCCYMVREAGRVVAFTAGNWSVAQNVDQWRLLQQFMFALQRHNIPEIFVPERHTDLVTWCSGLGFRLAKKMHVMVKGEYGEIHGIYCPSAEY